MDLIALQLNAAASAQRTRTSDVLFSNVPGYVPLNQTQFDTLKTNVLVLHTLTKDFKAQYSSQFTPPIATMMQDTIELTQLIVISLIDYAAYYSLATAPLNTNLVEN